MDNGYGAQAAIGRGAPIERPNGQIKDRALETKHTLERVASKLQVILMRTQGPVPADPETAAIDPDHITFIMQANCNSAERIERMVSELETFI